MPYRIVSFDGGGVWGVVPAILLRRIQEQIPDLLSKVDLYAGTSIGGVLALCLAKKITPIQIESLFKQHSKKVFQRDITRKVLYLFGVVSKYSNRHWRSLLVDILGDQRIHELNNKVFVPAFCINGNSYMGWHSKFFHNLTKQDTGTTLVDIAMATSAAPTFFPSYNGYVDGGITAANPALAAACLTQELANPPHLSEVKVLSFGSDLTRHRLKGWRLDRGWLRWAIPMVRMMLDTDNQVINSQCRSVLRGNYVRISPQMPNQNHIDLDDADHIGDLIKAAQEVDIHPYLDIVQKDWMK